MSLEGNLCRYGGQKWNGTACVFDFSPESKGFARVPLEPGQKSLLQWKLVRERVPQKNLAGRKGEGRDKGRV